MEAITREMPSKAKERPRRPKLTVFCAQMCLPDLQNGGKGTWYNGVQVEIQIFLNCSRGQEIFEIQLS